MIIKKFIKVEIKINADTIHDLYPNFNLNWGVDYDEFIKTLVKEYPKIEKFGYSVKIISTSEKDHDCPYEEFGEPCQCGVEE